MLGVGHAQDAAAMRLVVDDSAVLFLQLQTAFKIQQVWVYKHCWIWACEGENIFRGIYLQRAFEKGT